MKVVKKIWAFLKIRIWHQILFAFLININLKGFFEGKIFQGASKKVCLPVLNCYSCPGAVTSCPIGSLQYMLTYYKYHFSLLIAGVLGGSGILAGRWFCGHMCPFGLYQDLLKKLSKKNFEIWKPLRYLKYVTLFLFVLILPPLVKHPTFCSYICPAGTLEAGLTLVWFNNFTLGFLYVWKVFLLFTLSVGSVFIERPFCNTLCPLGILLGFFNKISILKMNVDMNKCIKCNKCHAVCPSDIYIYENSNSVECVRCGDCINVCPTNAITFENTLFNPSEVKLDAKIKD